MVERRVEREAFARLVDGSDDSLSSNCGWRLRPPAVPLPPCAGHACLAPGLCCFDPSTRVPGGDGLLSPTFLSPMIAGREIAK